MTFQIRDILYFEGEKYFLEQELLESKIKLDLRLEPKLKGISTDCWRGYVATFEIINSELILTDLILVENTNELDKEDFLNKLFENNNKQKVVWLNSLIVLYNKVLKFRFPEVPSSHDYEEYIILEMENGNLKDFKLLNLSEFNSFKQKQFNYYISTKEYLEYKTEYEIARIKSDNEKRMKTKNNKDKRYKFDEIEFKKLILENILSFTNKIY